MTPIECCEIGAAYCATKVRDLRSLERAARLHAEMPLNPAELERELRQRPELVDSWQRWDEDKRWSPSWYFSVENGRCLVGYFSTDEAACKSTTFENRYQACAAFIICELEDYRSLREQKGMW